VVLAVTTLVVTVLTVTVTMSAVRITALTAARDKIPATVIQVDLEFPFGGGQPRDNLTVNSCCWTTAVVVVNNTVSIKIGGT